MTHEGEIVTPSDAHNSAYDRSPEHDQMVVNVYEYIIRNGGAHYKPAFTAGRGANRKTRYYDHGDVECEKLYKLSRSTFFADIAVVSWSDFAEDNDSRARRYEHHLILEIKPKIYSAGAALRQVKAQRQQISSWIDVEKGSHEWMLSPEVWGTVLPVFKSDDPLLSLYDRMIEADDGYLTWDGSGRKLSRVISQGYSEAA